MCCRNPPACFLGAQGRHERHADPRKLCQEFRRIATVAAPSLLHAPRAQFVIFFREMIYFQYRVKVDLAH